MADGERASERKVLDAPADPTGEHVPTEPHVPIEQPVTTSSEQDRTEASEVEAGAVGTEQVAEPVRPRRLAVLLTVTVLAFVLDLVTKLLVVAKLTDHAPIDVVPKVLDLQLTRNPGAAFGVAGGATIIFTLVAATVVVFIVATARRLRSRGWAVALGLLLGGAVGNLGDRLFRDPGPLRGHVVDWIHLTHWPIFNVADSCIVLGGVLAVLLSLRGRRLDGTTDTGA